MHNRILQTSQTITSLNQLPQVVIDEITTQASKYFEEHLDENGEDAGVNIVNSDGSLGNKKNIDLSMRNAEPDEFNEEEIKEFERFSIMGESTITVEGGTEFVEFDDMSFSEDVVHTTHTQTIPLHYQVYYRMKVDYNTEELILLDALYHTHSFLEYLKCQ